MRKYMYLAALTIGVGLFSCQESVEEENKLEFEASTSEGFSEASLSFAQGNASNGKEYFNGILAAVVEVDVKLREVGQLDEMDASEEEITTTINEMIAKIDFGRKAIDMYTDKDWPKRDEFHKLTVEWFDVIENLGYDYLYLLAEPMSRIDETWTQDELLLFEDYQNAYEGFIDVDQRWIEFQYVFADANNFDPGEKLDMDAIVEENITEDI